MSDLVEPPEYSSSLDVEADLQLARMSRLPRRTSDTPQVCPASTTRGDLAPLPAPEVTDAMYCGVTGEVMKAAADGTEVNPAAAGLAYLSFAGTALGRTRHVRIGDDFHHPRIFSVHVGRSSVAGKGMALGITRRIREACERNAEPKLPACGNFHDAGLSSREGLAWAIRDASDAVDKDGETVDPGIADKRLFIVEEEFANVLEQSKRDGNTLSAALRTAWDGGDLGPLTKTNRTRATRPHIGMHACITPGELATCLASREVTNGFANRFLFVWAERQGVEPFPKATPDTVVERFAQQLQDAVGLANRGGAVEASQDARDRFSMFYKGHRHGLGLPARVRVLLERHPPYAWRLALIFALLDCKTIITSEHMGAALAWLNYCRVSVMRIFSTATVQADAEEAGALVQRIVGAIDRAGGAIDREPLREALGKPSASALDAAIEQAEMAGMIGITNTPREGGGRPRRTYSTKPAARFARLARFGLGLAYPQTAETSPLPRFEEPIAAGFGQTGQSADPLRFAEMLTGSQTAQIAQTADRASETMENSVEVDEL